MKTFVSILFFALLMQCRQKETSSNHSDLTATLSLKAYQDSLRMVHAKPEMLLHVLELFKNSFNKKDSTQCDLALKTFLDYQSILVDSLNNQLVKRADYDAINSLANSDPKLQQQAGKDFEQYIRKNGFQIKVSEGSVYIDSNLKMSETYFANYLTPSTKDFLAHLIDEEQGFSEDGGLTISPEQVAERLAFYDQFNTLHPQHIFSDLASANARTYLTILMSGLDNSPAFDPSTQKIKPEFLGACTFLIKKYPAINASTTIRNFIDLLNKNNLMRTDAVNKFINNR